MDKRNIVSTALHRKLPELEQVGQTYYQCPRDLKNHLNSGKTKKEYEDLHGVTLLGFNDLTDIQSKYPKTDIPYLSDAVGIIFKTELKKPRPLGIANLCRQGFELPDFMKQILLN